jgi:TP901 family phage tail tape measure protein
MAEVNPTISVKIDTSDSLRQIRNLQAQLSAFNDSVLRSSAQAVAAQKQFNSALNASVLGTKSFSTSIVKTSTEIDKFTTKLEKNKFSFGEYFKYGASQVGLFRRAFTNEFDTIDKVATERVKRLQTQYISLGKDANGVARSMAIIPNELDMSNPNTQLQLAAQRTQIFNKLLSDGSTKLLNFGKNTQWAGRQLMVGFTLPLVAFGGIASKTFMDLETQATNFKRVYGDLFTTTEETNRNLEAVKQLGIEYTKYGITLSDTMGVSAKAAAAGMQNQELMASTEQTLKLSTLGQIDYNQSLEATIALQSAFGITAKDLGTEIDFLNAVENQTVLSLDDVTKAIPRAATVVNGLGGNVRDLAAFMAAMKEGGVSAEQGANAIKSGLGSLINPTDAANEKLMNLGINIEKITTKNSGNLLATVQEFGKALDGLSSFERQQALETLFGKYQYARLGVLFQNINRQGSQAATVLKLAGESATDLAKLSEKELSIISETTTAKFQAAVEKLKVAIAPIGEEFLKILTPIADVITKIANWFNDLPDGVKKAVTIITVAVAGIGPVALMTFGLLANGIANIVKGLLFAKNVFSKFTSTLTGNLQSTQYLTDAELDAAAASASLEGRVETLTSSLLLQKDAVSDLITLYSRLAKQAQVTAAQMPQGFGPPIMGPLRTIRRMATGGFVGGTGNKDSEPALLAPGEFVVNAKAAAQYGPILGAMNAGTIKGYVNGTETKSVSVAGETVDLSSLRGSSSSLDSLIRALSRIEASGLDATEVLSGLRSIISNLSGNQGIPYVGRQLREMFPELKALTGLERAHVTAQQDATREALKTLAASEEITGSTKKTLQILDRINDVLSDAGLLKVETGTGSGARAAKRSNLVFNMEEGINKALSRDTGVSGSKLFQSLDKTGMKLYDTILQQAKAANMSEQELAQLASQSGILHNELLKLIDTTYREYTIKDKVTDEEIKTGAKVKAFGDIVKEAFVKVETETSHLKTFMDQLDTEFSTLRHTVSLTERQIAKLTELGYVIKTNQSGTSYDITTPEGQNITGVSRASSKTLSTGIAKETDFTKFGITQGEAIADGMLLGAGDIVEEMITRYRRSPHPAVVNAAKEDGIEYGNIFARSAQAQVERFTLTPGGLYVPSGGVTGGKKPTDAGDTGVGVLALPMAAAAAAGANNADQQNPEIATDLVDNLGNSTDAADKKVGKLEKSVGRLGKGIGTFGLLASMASGGLMMMDGTVGQIAQNIFPVVTAIEMGALAFTSFGGSAAGVTGALGAVGAAAGAVAAPVALIVAAVAALIAMFVLAYKKFEFFRNSIADVGNALKELFTAIVGPPEKIRETFSNIQNVLSKVGEYISSIFNPILEYFATVWSAIYKVVEVVIKIFTMLVGVVQIVSDVFAGVIKWIWEAKNGTGFLATALQFLLAPITILIEAFKLLPGVLSTVIDFFKDLIVNGVNKLLEGINWIIDRYNDLAEAFGKPIVGNVTLLYTEDRSAISGTVGAALAEDKRIREEWQKAKDFDKQMMKGAKDAWNKARIETTDPLRKKPPGGGGSGSEKEKEKTGKELFYERLDQLRKESGQLEKISYLQRQVGNYSSKMFEGLDPKAIQYLMKHQEELQKLIVAYRRLQEAKLVDHFQELGVKMNETYRIQSLMPMASAEMVSELMDLVDTTALTSDQIVKYGNKLLEVKRAQEAMKTSSQKLSEELSGLADVARSQIEQINRLEINPIEKQIQGIENAIASIQSAIAGLEASKAPLQSQIDALKKQEEELQKVYDERVKALESIKRANDAILAQQRGQLSIADALSRGDIAAAAAAQQDLQQTLDQQNAEEMRRAVEEDYNNQKEQIQNRIAAVEAQIAAIDAAIAAKQAEIAAKQAEIAAKQEEIAKAKEKQLALEEKIYKMQLLQSMIDTTKKISDAQRLGDTAGVQIGQALLASQLAITGNPAQFFAGLGLTPDKLQAVLQQIFTAGINPEQLVNMVGKETADAILKGINLANLGTVASTSVKEQFGQANIAPTVVETATKLSGIADKTKTAIDGVITQFNEGKIGLKTALLTIVGQMASALTEGLLVKTDTTAFSQALKEIGTSVQETVKSFSEKIGNAIIGLTTTLTNFNLQMNEKISAIAGAIGQIASGISSGTAGGIASVSAAMSSIGGSFGLMASNLSASVGSATSTINSAVGVLNGAAGALNGAAGAIYGAVGALAAAAAAIPRFSSGGLVPGLGNTDSVPAMLTPGEYVITKDVVNALGTDFLDKLNTGSMPTYAITSKSNGISAYSGQSSDSGSVYNYSVNVSAQSNANAGDIANIVMRKIKMTNKRTIKGNNY